jgi:hypothetical protein
MLATTTKNEDSKTIPMITGRSCVLIDCTASAPRPGSPKMFSAITTPQNRIATSMPACVTMGVSAPRSACTHSTLEPDRPLARALRT